jgi:hypothetical protein
MKEARTIDEAFYAGNDKCEFNVENIINVEKDLKEKPVYLRQIRVVPEKEKNKSIYTGKEYERTIIKPMDDQKGGWFIFENPNKPNHFEDRGGYIYPLNTHLYQVGVDTTKDLVTVDGSKPRILVLQKSLVIEGEEKGMKPVAMYLDETRLDVHFDDEVLKICKWYGCKANYEIDARTDYYRHFAKERCGDLLEWTPKIMQNPIKKNFKVEPGTRSGDPFQFAQQLQILKMYVDGTDDTVYNGHVHRIVFPTLLKQLRKFNNADRTKSDEVIALAMALAPMFGEQQIPEHFKKKPKQILQTYKLKMPA